MKVKNINNVNPIIIFLFGLLLTILIGWLDFISGPYLTFTIFYLIPVVSVTWFANAHYAFITALLSSLTTIVADLLWGIPISQSFVVYLNAVFRFVILLLSIKALSRIKSDLIVVKQSADKEKILARTDALTDIANTRKFYEVLQNEINKAKRYRHPIALAYIDLDNFKEMNDKYGHLKGDQLLKNVADIIQKNIRNIDTVARLGGDEFAILMPETTIENAKVAINRLNNILAYDLKKNRYVMTISIGLASFVKVPSSADIIVSRADELMYIAKQTGKNRIEEKTFDH